jgi:SAM-dependent methyltransferase
MKVTMQWANMADIRSPPFEALHAELHELENKIPTYRHDSDHNGRRFEYPWAILNSGVRKGDWILNAGSGTDVLGFYLSKFGYTINIDNDSGVIGGGMAQAKNNFPFLNFRVADIKNLPYDSEYFDKIFCISVLEHGAGKIADYYRELLRVLRVGGVLMITLDIGEKALPEATINEAFGVEPPPKPPSTLALFSEEDRDKPDKKYLYVLAIKVVKT